jgi:hypothetical protein
MAALSPIIIATERQDFTTCLPIVDPLCNPVRYTPGVASIGQVTLESCPREMMMLNA